MKIEPCGSTLRPALKWTAIWIRRHVRVPCCSLPPTEGHRRWRTFGRTIGVSGIAMAAMEGWSSLGKSENMKVASNVFEMNWNGRFMKISSRYLKTYSNIPPKFGNLDSGKWFSKHLCWNLKVPRFLNMDPGMKPRCPSLLGRNWCTTMALSGGKIGPNSNAAMWERILETGGS